jgi:hypothetical protein
VKAPEESQARYFTLGHLTPSPGSQSSSAGLRTTVVAANDWWRDEPVGVHSSAVASNAMNTAALATIQRACEVEMGWMPLSPLTESQCARLAVSKHNRRRDGIHE